MKWSIETLNNKVDKELEGLSAHLKAKFLHIANLLESYGPQHVREPYVKYIGNKLWEIRLKGPDNIARAIYVTARPKRVVILHVFIKKTQKTPSKNIELALSRLKEVR